MLSQGGPRDAAAKFHIIMRFLCHSTAFLLVFVCRLRWIICRARYTEYMT